MTRPVYHTQLKHTPIKRLLTALQHLTEAGYPLPPNPIDKTTPTNTNILPGEHTAWARNEKRRILKAIGRLANQAETKLGNPHQPPQPAPRCLSCGRKQAHQPTRYCPHCGSKNP